MSGLIYLYKRILVNRIRKALKRPSVYVITILLAVYVLMLVFSLGDIVERMELGTPENLSVVLSILMLVILPSNFISYARRKGLLFRKSDVHFVFPAPVNPKAVILFAGMRNLLLNIGLTILLAVFCLAYFHATVLQTVLYALSFLIFENMLEASMMVLCYGNEVLPKKFFTIFTGVVYALLGIFVVVGIWMLSTRDASFAVVREYLSLTVIQLVPVVGWNIALIRLIFVGPTLCNVVCSLLFVASTLVLFVLAYRSKCEGAYYEDAAKFADDYEELRARNKKGDGNIRMGKKTKYRKAEVAYKGSYAKAIFYRQLLEYKKSRFFIFGFQTVVSLIAGIGIAVWASGAGDDLGAQRMFAIPGIMAYVIFIFSGYATKWSKELENPYTFLIPDNSIRKLWYATKMEHIRSLVDGTLMTLPGAVILGLTPLQAVLIIFLYVCLMANKLYYFMVGDLIAGDTLGQFGRNLIKMFFQGIAIIIGVVAAAVGGIFLGIDAGFFIMSLVTLLITLGGAAIAAMSFGKMELRQG